MKRALFILLSFMAVAAMVLTAYAISMKRQIKIARNESRAQLEAYQNIFLSSINNSRHLPFTISRERMVLRLFENRADRLQANILLKAIQVRSGASAVYIMNGKGQVIASSDYDQPDSLIGTSFDRLPFFEWAMSGREGSTFVMGNTADIPGYHLSHPITLNSRIVGAAAIKIDMSDLQDAWKAAKSVMIAIAPDGVIAFSSNRDWLYRAFAPLSESPQESSRSGGLGNGAFPARLDVVEGVSMEARWVEIDSTQYLLNEHRVQGTGWELLALVPWSDMSDTSMLKALAVCLASIATGAALLFIRAQRMKTRMELRVESSRRARRIDREREESLRQLADSIAHQIRNPLLGIGGNANLLKRKLPEDESIKAHLGTIIRCCLELEQVVASVRDYIDIVPAATVPFDVEVMVAKSVSTAMAGVNPPDEAVIWHINLEAAELPLDESLVGKALHEILTNALEARDEDTVAIEITGKQGTPRLCTEETMAPNGKCYVLTVCDSGKGISTEIFPHVMDPFFSTKPHGTGLGLAKAKRVVQIFHGGLAIRSPVPEHAGCSTMVQLILPTQAGLEIE
jgi:two-component system C4-dicarboxylate transport sensor histidine kinase DctB